MRAIVLLLVIALISTAKAEVSVDTNVVLQINNANVSFSSAQNYSTIEVGADFVAFNGSTLQLTPSAQTEVTVNEYNINNSRYNITFTPSSGTVSMIQEILTPNANIDWSNTPYRFLKNGATYNQVNTNSSSWLANTFDSGIFLWYIAYDYSNTKTNDDSTNVKPVQEEQVSFKLLYEDMTQAIWEMDGSPLSEQTNTYTTSFKSAGGHVIKAYAITPEGSTTTTTWFVIVLKSDL